MLGVCWVCAEKLQLLGTDDTYGTRQEITTRQPIMTKKTVRVPTGRESASHRRAERGSKDGSREGSNALMRETSSINEACTNKTF